MQRITVCKDFKPFPPKAQKKVKFSIFLLQTVGKVVILALCIVAIYLSMLVASIY